MQNKIKANKKCFIIVAVIAIAIICLAASFAIISALLSNEVELEFYEKEEYTVVIDNDYAVFEDLSYIELDNSTSREIYSMGSKGILSHDKGVLTYITKDSERILTEKCETFAISEDESVVYLSELEGVGTHNLYYYNPEKDELKLTGKVSDADELKAYASSSGKVGCWYSGKSIYISEAGGEISNVSGYAVALVGVSEKDQFVYYFGLEDKSSKQWTLFKSNISDGKIKGIAEGRYAYWRPSFGGNYLLEDSEYGRFYYYSEDTGLYKLDNCPSATGYKSCKIRINDGSFSPVCIAYISESECSYILVDENQQVNYICTADSDTLSDLKGSSIVYVRDNNIYTRKLMSYTPYDKAEGFSKFLRFFYDYETANYNKNDEVLIYEGEAEIKELFLTEDKKFIYFINEDNELWETDFKGKTKQLASDVIEMAYSDKTSTIYYRTAEHENAAGTLFSYKNGKSKEVSEPDGVMGLYKYNDSVYYIDVSESSMQYNFDTELIGSKYCFESGSGKFETVITVGNDTDSVTESLTTTVQAATPMETTTTAATTTIDDSTTTAPETTTTTEATTTMVTTTAPETTAKTAPISLSEDILIAEGLENGQFYYDEYEHQVVIRGCLLDASHIEIPNEINGKSVTTIGNNAFWYFKNITSVTIPDGITKIDKGAFYNCKSLTNVIIPNGITEIGNDAFRYCKSLTSIIIPDSVAKIGSCAFYDCENLASVTLPDSITEISASSFAGTPWIGTVSQPLIINNMLVNYHSASGDVVIPDNVTKICEGAFADCSKLESVIIPDGVTEIGSAAFAHCSNLKSIVIPNGVTEISAQTFYCCSRLKSATIPDSVTKVGKEAFHQCQRLKNITYKGQKYSDYRLFYAVFNE